MDKDVLIQLSVPLGASFEFMGKPFPLMTKIKDERYVVVTDMKDAMAKQMTANVIAGKVVEVNGNVMVRVPDQVNDGGTMDVTVAAEIIMFVSVVGEKKSSILLS